MLLTAIYVFGAGKGHVSVDIYPSEGSDGGFVHDESYYSTR
jgi:hypothetical protein